MSNKNIAQYVMLAEASYADLTDSSGNQLADVSTSQNPITFANALITSGFAKTEDDGQITLLKDNWSVVANWKDREEESSFSATLFKGTEKSGQEANYIPALDFLIQSFQGALN